MNVDAEKIIQNITNYYANQIAALTKENAILKEQLEQQNKETDDSAE